MEFEVSVFIKFFQFSDIFLFKLCLTFVIYIFDMTNTLYFYLDNTIKFTNNINSQTHQITLFNILNSHYLIFNK